MINCDRIGGDLTTRGRQEISLAISRRVIPLLPITAPGFLASTMTSPSSSSNIIFVISALSGTISFIRALASSFSRRTDTSERITILFRRVFAKLFTMSPFSINTVRLSEYNTTKGPSNSTLDTCALGGSALIKSVFN